MGLPVIIGMAALKYAPIIISMLAAKAEKDHPKGEDGVKTGPKKLEQVLKLAPGILAELGIDGLSEDQLKMILEAVLAVGTLVDSGDDKPKKVKEGQAVAYPIQGTVTFTKYDPMAD